MNTPNKSLQTPANNSFVGTWDLPMNSNFSIIDNSFGGTLILATSPSGITLTAANLQNLILQINGPITVNNSLLFPAVIGGFFVVNNNTSGPFSIIASVIGSSGSTVTLPQGKSSLIYTDGVNVITPSGGFNNVDGVTIVGTGSVPSPLKTAHSIRGWWFSSPFLLLSPFSSGFSSITNPGQTSSVFTFTTPEPDTNYAVIMQPSVNPSSPSANYGCVVSAQNTTGFTVMAPFGGSGNSQIYISALVVR